MLFLTWVVWKDDGLPVLQNLIVNRGIGPLSLRYVVGLHIAETAVPSLIANLWLAVTGVGVAGAFLLFDRLVRGGIAVWVAGGRAALVYVLIVSTAGAYWAGILLLTYWNTEVRSLHPTFCLLP